MPTFKVCNSYSDLVLEVRRMHDRLGFFAPLRHTARKNPSLHQTPPKSISRNSPCREHASPCIVTSHGLNLVVKSRYSSLTCIASLARSSVKVQCRRPRVTVLTSHWSSRVAQDRVRSGQSGLSRPAARSRGTNILR